MVECMVNPIRDIENRVNHFVKNVYRRASHEIYHRANNFNYKHEVFPRNAEYEGEVVRTYELINRRKKDQGLRILLGNCSMDDVIYDVGANKGDYALATAKNRSTTVYAFEPNPLVFEQLVKNLRLNPTDNVIAKNVGLSNDIGQLDFYVSSEPTMGSFHRSHATEGDAEVTDVLTVDITTIDSFVEDHRPPDHVKIDVEGHEIAVLEGARKTIESHKPVIYLEVHDETVLENSLVDEILEQGYTMKEKGKHVIFTP